MFCKVIMHINSQLCVDTGRLIMFTSGYNLNFSWKIKSILREFSVICSYWKYSSFYQNIYKRVLSFGFSKFWNSFLGCFMSRCRKYKRIKEDGIGCSKVNIGGCKPASARFSSSFVCHPNVFAYLRVLRGVWELWETWRAIVWVSKITLKAISLHLI